MSEKLLEQISAPDVDHFVVEGRWCVEALLENEAFEALAVVRADGSHSDFDEKFRHLVEVHVVGKKELSRMMGFAFHRGIVALARRPEPKTISAVKGLLVACPNLADESNLGAIVRTSAALGMAGILVPQATGADVFSRKSIRASSGAVFRIPIYQCNDLFDQVRTLKLSGFTVTGTAAGPESIDLEEVSPPNDGIIVFGPEGEGLSSAWLDLCDVKLQIPMSHGMDSLNVAACAAIVLYQLSTGRRT